MTQVIYNYIKDYVVYIIITTMGGEEVPADVQKLIDLKKSGTKLTESQAKKIKQYHKALANPGKAADKKEKQDAKRARRKESGSVKVINR